MGRGYPKLYSYSLKWLLPLCVYIEGFLSLSFLDRTPLICSFYFRCFIMMYVFLFFGKTPPIFQYPCMEDSSIWCFLTDSYISPVNTYWDVQRSSNTSVCGLYIRGITVLCHFRKHDLMPVIICKNYKHLVTLYYVICSNMTRILSHLRYVFY